MTERPIPQIVPDEVVSEDAREAVTRAVHAAEKLKRESERRRHEHHQRRIAKTR